jgi:hypothetical protein
LLIVISSILAAVRRFFARKNFQSYREQRTEEMRIAEEKAATAAAQEIVAREARVRNLPGSSHNDEVSYTKRF